MLVVLTVVGAIFLALWAVDRVRARGALDLDMLLRRGPRGWPEGYPPHLVGALGWPIAPAEMERLRATEPDWKYARRWLWAAGREGGATAPYLANVGAALGVVGHSLETAARALHTGGEPGRAAAWEAPRRLAAIVDVRRRLGALEPPPDFEPLHASLCAALDPWLEVARSAAEGAIPGQNIWETALLTHLTAEHLACCSRVLRWHLGRGRRPHYVLARLDL